MNDQPKAQTPTPATISTPTAPTKPTAQLTVPAQPTTPTQSTTPIPPAQTESPITPKPKVTPVSKAQTMDLFVALRHVNNGKKIKRLAWPDPRDYCFMSGGWLTILRGTKFHTWNINDGDMEGQDWVIVND